MRILDTMSEFEEALDDAANELVVIDFFATWCGPCKRLAPQLENLEKKYKHVHFHKVDVEENIEVSEKYKVTGMPTILFFKKKKLVKKIVGDKIEEIIKTLKTLS